MKRIKTDILIIGAGPYGIALANYLHHQKKSFVVVGRFMDLWRNHTYDSMILRSDFSTSEIPHPEGRFSADNFIKQYPEFAGYRNERLPVYVYRQYLDWVEANLEYPVIDDFVDILEIAVDFSMHLALYLETHEYSDHKFCAILRRRRNELLVFAKNIVVATGPGPHAIIPADIKSDLNKIHSYETRKIEALSNKKVLVIGGGQSAAESIESLKEKNEVAWNTPHSPTYLEQPVNISPWLFETIVHSATTFHALPLFLRKFLNKLFSRPTIRPPFKSILDKTKTTTSLGEAGRDKKTGYIYDAVVAATGFNYNIENLTFLSPNIRAQIHTDQDLPTLDHTFQSTCAKLYFTGGVSEPCFGAALKFIIGANFAADMISKHIHED